MKKLLFRLTCLLLAAAMCLPLCPPALAAGRSFSDLSPSHWAYDDIMACVELGTVTGFENGTFRPEAAVTSAQFITMLTQTFYAGEVAAVTDTTGQPWYYAYVRAAENRQITKGLASVTDTPMSRYDMAVVLNNIIDEQHVILLVSSLSHRKYVNGEIEKPLEGTWAYEKAKAAQQSIRDWDSIPEQYGKAVSMCYALGALTGMSNGTFSGTQTMTRAQACVVITRMKDLAEGRLPDTVSQSQTPTQPQQPETPRPAVSGKLLNGQDCTVANVQAILEQIKREYPTGTSWGDPAIVGTTNYYADGPHFDRRRDVCVGIQEAYGPVSLKYGCGGWAAMVSERIFGKTGAPTREITDITKARPGDIVVEMNHKTGDLAHVAIFLQYVPAYTYAPDGSMPYQPEIITCDGNSNGKVYWGSSYHLGTWPDGTGGLDLIGTDVHILTRYPTDPDPAEIPRPVGPENDGKNSSLYQELLRQKNKRESVKNEELRCANCGYLMREANAANPYSLDINSARSDGGSYMECTICFRWYLCEPCKSNEKLTAHKQTCQG